MFIVALFAAFVALFAVASPLPCDPPTARPTPTPTPTPVPAPPTTAAPTASSPTGVSDMTNGPFTGGIATYFYQNGNPGACGQVRSDADMICAMDQTRFGTDGPASPLCGRTVQITNTDTNQQITVTVADDCPTCQNANSIDLSVAAFQALAPLSQGIFPIEWSYVS